jgi:hypothetical protein
MLLCNVSGAHRFLQPLWRGLLCTLSLSLFSVAHRFLQPLWRGFTYTLYALHTYALKYHANSYSMFISSYKSLPYFIFSNINSKSNIINSTYHYTYIYIRHNHKSSIKHQNSSSITHQIIINSQEDSQKHKPHIVTRYHRFVF